mgnify:FL=1
MQKIQNTQFTISTNKMFNNSIFIKTNLQYNLTYMCSSMQKVALCLQAHNLKNATVKFASNFLINKNAVQTNLAHATYIRIANA